MRRIVFLVVCALALSAVSAALARDPRAETERLRPADMTAARASLLRLQDLNTGWARDKQPDDDDTGSCPSFNPDRSRFVMTGKADAAFKHPAGAWLVSHTEIYTSRAHAVGDFRSGARPELARCLRYAFEHEFSKQGVTVRVLSARMLAAPRLGERATRFQVVARITGSARTLTMYMDMVAFQQDRAISMVMTMSVSQPIRDGATLARVMLARLR